MENNSHIQYCVTYTLCKKVDGVSLDGTHFHDYVSFENEELAKTFYEKMLEHEDLYSANFCKVLQTTEC